MKFKATPEQVKQIIANAVNAAIPVGMGFLHFIPKTYTAADIPDDRLVHGVDYFDGRMTKLYIESHGDGTYSLPDDKPRRDYQSWCGSFPTYRALVESAGAQCE